MDEHQSFVIQKRMERTKAALDKNGMPATIVSTAAEVVPLVRGMVPPGSVVSNGGSATLEACGVIALLHETQYTYLDRKTPEKALVEREAFKADAYFASANAITENGEVFNMDGNGNRVAAIAFGPASVILVAGYNKLVPTLEDARQRRAWQAAPANCHRLKLKTPCAVTGLCSNCQSEDRICSLELVLHKQRQAGRIKVILVGEALGY